MRYILILPLLLCFFAIRAQISIEFPRQNMVIQRDLNNQAQVLVSGYIDKVVDKIQLRFVPKQSGWGTQTEWQTCDLLKNNSTLGFTSTASVSGGWYIIEVKGLLNNNEVASFKLDAFGVGEVFIIAGQSNAQGQGNAGEKNAEDDRVIIIGGYDTNLNSSPNYNFFKMLSYFSIYPVGNGAWYWSELGDKLVAKLNVPVLFLNTAWGGSSSFDWAKSIDNKATRAETPANVPYFYLKRTLQYYSNTIGFRAVLWHQGESDNGIVINKTPTSLSDYFENIKKVIDESRLQAESPLGWVISKASYGLGITSEKVISAQERLINEVENVYLGPSTDDLKDPYRLDDLHFSNKSGKIGLTTVANRWNEALSTLFFETCVPKISNYGNSIILECDNELTYPANLKEKNWGNKYVSHSFLIDKNDNYYISKIKTDLSTLKPVIKSSSTSVCEQNRATLKVADSFGYPIRWNNGLIGNEIKISYPGNYYATLQNVKDCILNLPSNTITLSDATLSLLPQSPKITSLNTTLVCNQNPTILKVSTPENYEVVWNTGQVSSELIVTQKGDYFSYFREKNGCRKSTNSEVYQVKDVSSIVLPPIIKNKMVACENDSIELKVNTNYDILWNNDEVSNPLIVKNNGEFSYRIKAQNDCVTGFSNSIKIAFLNKPKPVTNIERTNLFELTAKLEDNSSLPLFEWTLDDKLLQKTTPSIIISNAGLYKVKAYFNYDNNISCYADSKIINEYLIQKEEFNKSYFVYPNPLLLGNVLNISRLTPIEFLNISIVSLEGKFIFSEEYKNENSFKITNLQAGNFILKLEEKDGKVYTQRIIVQ